MIQKICEYIILSCLGISLIGFLWVVGLTIVEGLQLHRAEKFLNSLNPRIK